jgi:hypothetical protein
MARGIRNGDFVKVMWVDSAATARWMPLDEAEKFTAIDCITLGILVNRDSQWVRVAQTRDMDTDDNYSVVGLMVIPKVAVTSITRVVET